MAGNGRGGRDVFIVDALRTPIGRGKDDGALHGIHPVDLLAMTLEHLVQRVGVDKAQVEDVVTGCVTPIQDQGANIARLAVLKAGFPIEVPGVQLNRFCGSSQEAVHSAAQSIASGDADLTIGSGVEMMSRVRMGSDNNMGPEFAKNFPYALMHQGVSAEMVAEKWALDRDTLDDFSAQSHCRAGAAQKAGWTRKELFPIETGSNGDRRTLDFDEGVRANPDRARMSTLKTVFKENGVVTAGNSSQISDGASAVLLASESKMRELSLKPRARLVARVVVGSDPVMMLTGPIAATQKALARAGLQLDDISAFEINEAFASVPLAWAKELHAPLDRLNVQGGAIAHGHPLGATGAVLMTKLVNILERTGGRYGLQSMCIGFGMATATIVERL